MDRIKVERAIAGLTEWQKHVQTNSDIDKDISTAIEALKAQLSQEGQEGTTSDLISRQAARHALCKAVRRRCRMIPEDAIWILELIRNRDARTEAEKDAVNAAIEALKAQLTREGKTKGATSDLISKTETVEHLRRMLEATVPNTDYDEGFVDGVEFGISTVSTMPTIQPQSTAGQLNDGAQSTVQSTDLIDRGQAIEKFTMTAPQMSVIRIYEAVEILESMPTIQPEPQWIPVSERLPEGYADVLCCNKYADMMIGMIYENSASDTRFSVESDAEIMHDVIAWMPLPTPYTK